jgi:hypothetical protein
MRVLFSGSLLTSYRQFTVLSPDQEDIMPDDARAGQVNGLCGGAVHGGLFLTVGIHTGQVPMRVELHPAAPPIDQSWDEIVEASCEFAGTPLYLFGWAGDSDAELDMPDGQYRARFCARAFGATEQLGGDSSDSGEHYLLMFWPEAPRPDQILKQTAAAAIYWHQVAAGRA